MVVVGRPRLASAGSGKSTRRGQGAVLDLKPLCQQAKGVGALDVRRTAASPSG